MISNTLILDPRYPDCTLTSYIHEPYAELNIGKRRAIIICPGGAYMGLSEREAEPIALQFCAAGLNAFVLRYSICNACADAAPLIQAALAVKHVRERADEYHIDPDYVFISGFSAGGHVSACASSFWKQPLVTAAVCGDPRLCRPTGAVLCYPYIAEEGYRRVGTVREVVPGLCEAAYSMLLDFPADRYVDAETSPAFIWHTFDDTIVPIQNTLLYASALAAAGVPFEYHVYPTGVHGLGLANSETSSGFPLLENHVASAWVRDAVRWCKELKV